MTEYAFDDSLGTSVTIVNAMISVGVLEDHEKACKSLRHSSLRVSTLLQFIGLRYEDFAVLGQFCAKSITYCL